MELAVLFAMGLVAFAIETTLGFGATVVTVALATQIVTLDELLPALLPINMVLSSWILCRGWRLIDRRVLVRDVAPSAAAGAALGLALFHVPDRLALQLIFALSVIGLSLFQLIAQRTGPGARNPAPAITAPGSGSGSRLITRLLFVIGGLAQGLFGTGGPMIVYALRDRIGDKRRFRATLAVVWLTMAAALMTNCASMGLFTAETWPRTMALGAAVVPGVALGEKLHHRLVPGVFQRTVLILLLVACTILTVRTGMQLVRG